LLVVLSFGEDGRAHRPRQRGRHPVHNAAARLLRKKKDNAVGRRRAGESAIGRASHPEKERSYNDRGEGKIVARSRRESDRTADFRGREADTRVGNETGNKRRPERPSKGKKKKALGRYRRGKRFPKTISKVVESQPCSEKRFSFRREGPKTWQDGISLTKIVGRTSW